MWAAWSRVARWLSCAAVFAALLWLPSASHAYSFGPTVRQAGVEQQAFDWGTHRCDADDYPDSPARAFRDAQNKTQLITGAPVNRRMRGSSLLTVVRECPAIMASHRNPDPAAYDDAEWIAATWTADGKTIHALVHDEYRGFQVPGMCPSGTYLACWYNAVTYARSTKSGTTYTHARPPAHLVASLPYRYAADTGPYGIFEPSNVLRTQRPGDAAPYYYSLVHVEDYPKVDPVQRAGVCVMRTSNIADPASWRAWDGTAFAATFTNPYAGAPATAGHICSPVSYPQIEKMNSSVTYSEYLGRYLLVGMSGQFDPARGQVVHGFYLSTSIDLVTWSDRRLLMEAPLPWTCPTGAERQIAYPSLLDPASTSRNYETTGRQAMLYFTRLNAPCGGPPSQDRDLVRIPIEFLPGAA
jgi:hypothetical protein